ncbi:TonB-dependent receptor plug domain-containing protein [Algibacillus agarilyticus]|uniref:TonB-dependent receptor plug domain-containing protein n=1 Tax=Algibacillus agarilyticus TaxID=2234133 RepID=UPI000DCF8756|nr:TonB-dependent receptor plug domain-containing protein [Algibacillus agarilyticus]
MRIVPLLLLMLVTVNVHSSDTYALLDLSLEELLRIKITTVSKKEETIADAPGIVTVFTADDIQAFGARNLKDVLLRIPNYYLFDSHTFYSTGSTLRAGATQHLNNHILYLVNGRPLRESQNGGRQTDINLLFPVSAIDHLEVIRGPGSVLYGSNAFSGTINIITKKETSGIGAGVNITMGEHNYKALEGNAFAGTDDASVHAYINIIDNDGMPVSAFDVEGNLGGINNNRQGHFAKVDASYKGLSLETMFSELNLPSVSGRYRWSTLGDWTHTRNYFNIGYLHSHNKNWTSSINLSQNNLKMYIPVPTPTTYSSNDYLF